MMTAGGSKAVFSTRCFASPGDDIQTLSDKVSAMLSRVPPAWWRWWVWPTVPDYTRMRGLLAA